MDKLYLSLLLSTFCAPQLLAQTAKKNNVIFVYGDDIGRGMISFYGQKQLRTSHIDELFQKGVSFENVYWCMFSAPARASMLTGYHDCGKNKWNITGGGK